MSPDKKDIIDISINEWKDKIEIQPETTSHEWEEDTGEPLKQTDLVRRHSVVTLHFHWKNFCEVLELDPTNAGPFGIIKGQKMRHMLQFRTLKFKVLRKKNRNSYFDNKIILKSLINLPFDWYIKLLLQFDYY